MREIFQKEGVPLEIDGNRSMLLRERGKVWMVQGGSADLYSVFLKGGRPAGIRSHLFRLEQGDCLFSAEASQYPDENLLVSGLPGTRAVALDASRFRAALEKNGGGGRFHEWVRGWTGGMYRAVRPDRGPESIVFPEAGSAVRLEKDAHFRTPGDLVWVRVREGSLKVLGEDNVPVIRKGEFFPLCGEGWLTAAEESIVVPMETGDYLGAEPDLGGFYRFLDICLAMAGANRLFREAEEEKRLKRKLVNDAAAYDLGLKNLASVMVPAKAAEQTGGDDTPLFRACAMVGESMGIDFRPMPGTGTGREDDLEAITRYSGVRKRAVTLKGAWWESDNGPMLAFSEGSKAPLALIPNPGKGYRCIDPSSGTSRRVDNAAAEEIQPFAVVFYRSFPAKSLTGTDLFRFSFLKNRRDLFLLMSMGLCGAVLGLVVPMATGMIFDTIIPEAARFQLFQLGYILVVCAAATGIFEITRGIASLRLEGKIDAGVQSAVMDRLLLLSPPFFRRFTAGDLAERTLGINAIRQALSSAAITSVLSSVFSLFYFVLLFRYSWKLALVALGLTLVSVVVTGFISYRQVKNRRSLATLQGRISGMLLQFITGISKLRITGSENRAFLKWAEAFGDQERIAYKSGLLTNFISAFNSGFPILAAGAIFFSVVQLRAEGFSTGTFLAFNAAYGNFQNALVRMSATIISLMDIVPLYERAKPILGSVPETNRDKLSPGKLKGDIEIRHINFRYLEDGPLVLDDVSMEIKAGEFVAVVGSSGSGKSTLFRLLVGFETQETGTVYYDGQDLATLDVGEVRRQIGVVLQHSRVMPGSILKNIIGSSSRLTIDDAWEAARAAGLEEDIKAMPMGMHTMLQAGGGTLSGGQKQRLMIARAVVNKPGIIYFDEATSALDNRTQAVVIRGLERLRATRVVIAHRLSTIVNADRIFVLEKGRIAQSGTYEELMEQPGFFAELAKRQIA